MFPVWRSSLGPRCRVPHSSGPQPQRGKCEKLAVGTGDKLPPAPPHPDSRSNWFKPPSPGFYPFPKLTVPMPGFGHPAAVTSQAPSPAIPGGNVPRVTSRPVLLLQDGDGPGMAPASRSCPTRSSHPCVSLHIPTCAVPRGPPRAPGHPALLRECRWHPENQPWPEGDTAITTLGTVKIWWLRVELPWAMSQRLRALGWVWRGQRGTSPADTG